MVSHHKPDLDELPAHEPVKLRRHARHIEPRVRYLPVSFVGRPRGKGQGKPFVCDDCGRREATRDEITAHWRAVHTPKPVVQEDIICVSVHVDGEAS